MPLALETFSNIKGGNAFFKAITHPLAAAKATALLDGLSNAGSIAIYDPLSYAAAFDEVYALGSLSISEYFVQDVSRMDGAFGKYKAALVTELGNCKAEQLLVLAFDADVFVHQIRNIAPPHLKIVTLDAMRLPASMSTDRTRYLSLINFATNVVFFRDWAGHHTRLTTTNYWASYGTDSPALWCRLYDEAGIALADWQQTLGPAGSTVILDSQDIRARFHLKDFVGQLFLHAVNIAGHDVIKYALDTYGDTAEVLSCTHDANSWPAEYFAGLPAPAADEAVVLWIQNSNPIGIPPGEIGLRLMGDADFARLMQPIPPFGTYPLNVGELLPAVRWPEQIEIAAGKYLTRPRYEITGTDGRRRIAHVNVERDDLKSDENLPRLAGVLGKGYILPSPLPPPDRFETVILPTPMATTQRALPLKALVYDADGELVFEHKFGNISRSRSAVFDVGHEIRRRNSRLSSGYGHVELVYDFAAGKEADGWLHAIFRFTDNKSGHVAESSFGSHIFNTVVTYKDEPQSYKGRPPGLSTRLYLRIGMRPCETFCHLIYPASLPWRDKSDTKLILFDRSGAQIAKQDISIACSGSYLFRVSEIFKDAVLHEAGEDAYIIVQDGSCRLFGYHGLARADAAFSLDHMFGF
jgi:hypothetical protein